MYRFVGDGTRDYVNMFEGEPFYDVFQEKSGKMWVKKRNGFVIYDPQTRTFKDELATAQLLDSDVWISHLALDELDNIWWHEGETVYVMMDSQKLRAGEIEGTVADMCCRKNITYVLTEEGFLYRFAFDANARILQLPLLSPMSGSSDSGRFYSSLFVDSSQNIWISQGNYGVWFYKYGSTTPLHLTTDGRNAIQRGFISAIEEDAEGNIWLASDHGGICICDKNAKVLTYLKNDPYDTRSVLSNSIYALYTDPSGNTWVGYTKKGLSVYRGENKTWEMVHLDILHQQDLPEDINTICEDRNGHIWLGTDGSGLICSDPATGKETVYTTLNSNLKSNVITNLYCDSENRMWIGTFFGGLSCIENGRMRTYTYSEGGLSSDNVWSIDSDEAGRIWLGNLGGGLQMLDPDTGRFETYTSLTHGLSNDYVQEIICGENGYIYVATAYGLTVFDPHTCSSRILCHPDDMINGVLSGILVDDYGLIWLNEDGVLQIYDPVAGVYHTPENPALSAIRGMMTDKTGRVWVITDSGLCKADVSVNRKDGYVFDFDSFSFSQTEDLHFNQRSAYLGLDGAFYIGSYCGYLKFHPSMFSDTSGDDSMKFYFTELYVSNQKIKPGAEYGKRLVLSKAMEFTESIELGHEQSVITVEYALVDYLSVKDNSLYYKMEGLSQEWIHQDINSRRITFANLSPGRYKLYLSQEPSATDSCISLAFRILPPWWKSWWAYLLYFTFSSVLLMITYYLYRQRHKAQEIYKLKAMEQEKRHYVNEMKMQFFTNVSHEFRTPLTLILTPIEEKISKNPELKDDLFISTIHRNALRLLNLVNEVLDMRKIEMFGSDLKLGTADLNSVVKDALTSFRLMAQNQAIDLTLTLAEGLEPFDFDSGKVTKVVTNLLSNAFKYTPKGGYVHVEVLQEGDALVRVNVKDSGKGVEDKDKRRIFDRFYQSKDSAAGSGIGLHVVREFVLLHGGEIEVRDNEPVGSVFTFTLPVKAPSVKPVADNITASKQIHTPVSSDSGNRPVVLVVDDNDDFREFMCSSLKDEYTVMSACDGKEALDIVRNIENDIDVVVSDVMMPVMDGTEFCRNMKSDINTSHIPVILLTAKSLADDECYGLESGADDYLTKPFNMSILRLRIAKFIEWKRKTKKMFEQELEITTEQITLTSMDDRLLQQAISVINENISNPDFSVTDLSTALCMHRTSLYKKLLYITGKTPVEFIRALRLKRAAVLLETDGVYISEIAYMVGFNSPKVFASHFKEEFGCSPTEYRKNRQ